MQRPIRRAFTIPPGAQFGASRAGGRRRHQGTDYHVPIGTPIYGIGPGGVVTFIGYNGSPIAGFGHYIQVRYPNGVATLDAHLVARPNVIPGQRVDENTVLGYVGITGNAVNASPPGSHDHAQLTVNGALRNPEAFYAVSAPAGGGTPVATPNIPIGEEDMAKPEFWPGGIIFWPNGFLTTYDPSVYNALKIAFANNGVEQRGTEGTLAREIWTANNFMVQQVVKSLPDNPLSDTDKAWIRLAVQQEVAAIIKSAPPGSTAASIDYAALAAAVNTDASKRLAN